MCMGRDLTGEYSQSLTIFKFTVAWGSRESAEQYLKNKPLNLLQDTSVAPVGAGEWVGIVKGLNIGAAPGG